jgi:hypothetical protein
MKNAIVVASLAAISCCQSLVSWADEIPMQRIDLPCRIGDFGLGTTEQVLLDELANRGANLNDVTRESHGAFESISHKALNFVLYQGRVERIFTSSADFPLPNGLAVSSTMNDVIARLGQTETTEIGEELMLAYECSDSKPPDPSQALVLIVSGGEIRQIGTLFNRQ